MTRKRHKTIAVLAATALGVAALAGVALARVVIYSNPLSSNQQGKELRKAVGSRQCHRTVKGHSLFVQLSGGPVVCGLQPPVEGDSQQPNLDIQAQVKLLKSTPNKFRKRVYLGVDVRRGNGKGYELRVFPKGHKFKLLRTPKASGFPVGGKNNAVKPPNKWNTVRLLANGSTVKAFVNHKLLAKVKDASAADLPGRRALVIVANAKKTQREADARVDDVVVAVPSP